MSATQSDKEWSQSEFRGADLGDSRLEKRLQKVAAELASNPEAPINQASEDWAATKAAYRLFQNKRVSSKAILKSHISRTLERMKGESVILAIQDTSYLNFSDHKKTRGLGPIGDSRSDSQGLIMHTTLAVTSQGSPLGTLRQEIWSRTGYKKESKREQKNTPIQEKESYRWIKGLEETQALKSPDSRMVTLCDRESDIYEFFVSAQNCQAEFVIRASWNRHLEDTTDYPRIWEQVQAQPVAHTYSITLLPTEKRQGRTAHLELRFTEITIRPPQRPSGSLFYPLPPAALYAIHVIEVNPPKGEEKIEWMLLTNIPVHTLEQAIEEVLWYRCRWQIEVFHRILKSGCTVEECRLQTDRRLGCYIALMSVVAWRLFWMTHLKRTQPNAPASLVLTQNELRTLVTLQANNQDAPTTSVTVADVVIAIAKMGGFLARKHDRHPGPTHLWRGWTSLQNAALLGAVVFKKSCG